MIPRLSYQMYSSFFQQNDCTPANSGELSEYTDSAHTEVEDPSSRYMNPSDEYDRCGHDTRHFILPAPSVGGLPISQDWLDRMKLARNRTIPITLPIRKNTIADTISIENSNDSDILLYIIFL